MLYLFTCLLVSINAQTVLYQEDFLSQSGKGVAGPSPYVYDTIGMTWTIDPGTSNLTENADYFKVNATGAFEARDVDGDVFWISPLIDISTLPAVNIQVDISEIGNISGSEYIKLYYIIDNGSPVLFDTNGENIGDFSNLVARQDSLYGSSLKIQIQVRNSAGTHFHLFDNIKVYEHVANVSDMYELADLTSVKLKWTTPNSVFDEVLVVANENGPILSGIPSGNGTSYIADQVLGNGTTVLGGHVIYKGIFDSVEFSGVNPTHNYFIKVFTRKGTTWSTGIEMDFYYNPPSVGNLYVTEYARHPTTSDYSYLELYNKTSEVINLSGVKIIVNNTSSISEIVDLRTEVPNPIIVPANGFLILNRNRSQNLFENEWGVDLANTGYPVNYNRTGISNFGNQKFFDLKLGGNQNTDDGVIIDQTTVKPALGKRTIQLPKGHFIDYNLSSDSASPGFFNENENFLEISLAYYNGAWRYPVGSIYTEPSSLTGSESAVIINGEAPFNDGSEVNNLFIWPNASMDLSTETVTVNTNLIVEDDGSIGITSTGELLINGVTTIKRKGYNQITDFNIWGTPFSTLLDIQTTFPNSNPCDMFVFQASTQSFKHDFLSGSNISCNGNTYSINSSNVIHASEGNPDGYFDVGRGYFLPGNSSNTIAFSGNSTSLNNGPISVNLFGSSNTVISGSNDWNLISNPYPSAISANAFLSSNSGLITNAVYVYNPNTGINSASSFSTYNSTDGFNIASCQGFYVDANSATNGLLGVVNFTNAMRNNQNDDFRNDLVTFDAIYLSVHNKLQQREQIRLYFNENAKIEFDYLFDAHKMFNEKFNFAFPVDSHYLVFNGIPMLTDSIRVIPLFFGSFIPNQYTISMDSIIGNFEGYEIYLEDRFARKLISLELSNYTFETEPKDWNHRFFIHFIPKLTATGIEKQTSEDIQLHVEFNQITLYSNDKNTIIRSAEIISIAGAVLKNSKGQSNKIIIDTEGLSSGIYIIKYVGNEKEGVKKVVIP